MAGLFGEQALHSIENAKNLYPTELLQKNQVFLNHFAGGLYREMLDCHNSGEQS